MLQKTKQKTIVGLRELRENIETYITEVNKGKTFTIVRRSEPVFKISPADEWGDDGVWETVMDFREIDKSGVSVGKILKSLRKIDG